ncbi:MAG: outer membrane protein assembly factor BamC [Granulosicoccus sp.]
MKCDHFEPGKTMVRQNTTVGLSAICLLFISGCGSLNSQNSPDVVYAATATEARSLQVPPDLTDVSNAEQFVLPGTSGGAVARNTLLPQFESVRFVREGGQSWLEFQQTPEDLWPQLLEFARKEKYRIDQTEPVAGVIVTQWRPASALAGNNILRNLVADDEEFTRIAFRLERAGAGARLFARMQSSSKAAVDASSSPSASDWPVRSHNPESTSALLNRFLVFLGVEQQKARGILGADQARAVIDDAVLQRTSSGNEVLVNRGYQTSFRQVLAALQAMEYIIVSSDDNSGRIEFTDAQTPLVVQLSPVHISAVRVLLSRNNGAKLPAEREQQLLSALVQQLA